LASESFMVSSEVLKRGFRAFVSWLFVLVRVSRVSSLLGSSAGVRSGRSDSNLSREGSPSF